MNFNIKGIFLFCAVFFIVFLANGAHALLINEVELNPEGNDSGNEWIELFSEEEVNLEGHFIESNDGDVWNLSSNFSGYFIIDFSKRWLNNVNESVTLRNDFGAIVDETGIIEDEENNNFTWSRCENGWLFLNATKGKINDCFVGDTNNGNETNGNGAGENNETDSSDSDIVIGGEHLGILLGLFGQECGSEEECFYDFNKDGKIDEVDMNLLLALWGTDGVFDMFRADVNKNGVVDSADLGLVLGAWGKNCDLGCDEDVYVDAEVDDVDKYIVLAMHGTNFNDNNGDNGSNGDSSSSSSSGGGGGGGGGSTIIRLQQASGVSCFTEWECSEWSACANGQQTRICTKQNPECFAPGFIPESIMSCEEESLETGATAFFSAITGAVIGEDGSLKPTGIFMFIALLIAAYAFVAAWRTKRTHETETTMKKNSSSNGNKKKSSSVSGEGTIKEKVQALFFIK